MELTLRFQSAFEVKVLWRLLSLDYYQKRSKVVQVYLILTLKLL